MAQAPQRTDEQLDVSLAQSQANRKAMEKRFGTVPKSILKLSRGSLSQSLYNFANEQGKSTGRGKRAKEKGGRYEQRPSLRASGGGSRHGQAWSIMPAELVEFFVKYYARPGDVYLDPFMGHGVRLQVAHALKLHYRGYDLSEIFFPFIKRIRDKIDDKTTTLQVVQGDSREPSEVPNDCGDFCFTSPPYWDIEYYGDDEGQLGTGKSYTTFLKGMRDVGAAWLPKFKPGAYAVLNVSDFRKDGRFYSYHADVQREWQDAGWVLHDCWIVDELVSGLAGIFAVSTNMRRIAPKVHEYAIVFRAPGEPIATSRPSQTESALEPQSNGESPDVAQLAKAWRADNAPHCLGGFSNVRAKAVQDAAASGELLRVDDAAAIVTRRASAGKIVDFTGETIAVAHKGTLDVKHFYLGTEKQSSAKLAEIVRAYATDATIWLTTFAERKDHAQFAKQCGLKYAGSKIRSTSEVHALYSDESNVVKPAQYQLASLCRIKLGKVAARTLKQLAARLREIGVDFADHYSNYNPEHSWSAVSLRGYQDDPAFIAKPVEMHKDWIAEHPGCLDWELRDTSLREQLSDLVEPLLKRIPGEHARIRLMRLKASTGVLERHTDLVDKDSGPADGQLVRVHLPIVTDDRVVFDVWDHRGKQHSHSMRAGEFWYIDTRKPHRCANESDVDRVHLVVDTQATDEIRELLCSPIAGV